MQLQHRLARLPLHDAAVEGADPDVVRFAAVRVREVEVVDRLAGDRLRSGKLRRSFFLLRIEHHRRALPDTVYDVGWRQLVRAVTAPDHALMLGFADPVHAIGFKLNAFEARRRTGHFAANT